MLRVGLTGGVGAGKSLVAGRLDELGAVLVDADVIAREVVAPGTPGLDAVVAEFGPDVLDADGALNRPRLAKIVFGDEARRQALNAIIHPLVYQRRHELVEAAAADAIVVEDIPLLVENRLAAHYQLVIVVEAPETERVRRLVVHRGMSEDDARARIRAQASDEERAAVADARIDNSGAPEDTLAAVDALWADRLVPFETNLRSGVCAPRPPHPVIEDPDPTWPAQAARLIEKIRRVVGERAISIAHTGSTSVPGLAAKNVIDLQVLVPDLATTGAVADQLIEAGLVRRAGRWWDVWRDGTERDKQLACNADPARAVNCHIRPETSPTWRDALLLRDWLRATPAAVDEYAALKRRLAAQPHESIDHYAEAKTPWINSALERADRWAAETGWTPI